MKPADAITILRQLHTEAIDGVIATAKAKAQNEEQAGKCTSEQARAYWHRFALDNERHGQALERRAAALKVAIDKLTPRAKK